MDQNEKRILKIEHWITLASLVVAVAVLLTNLWYFHGRAVQEHQINSANQVMALYDRYYFSPSMTRERKKMSGHLLRHDPIDLMEYEFLDRFEMLGLLTRRGVIDPYIAWSMFESAVENYYKALTSLPDSTNYLKQIREKNHDSSLYQEFEWLNNCFLNLSQQSEHRGAVPTDEEVMRFLKDENRGTEGSK